jgi:hypothetical protein
VRFFVPRRKKQKPPAPRQPAGQGTEQLSQLHGIAFCVTPLDAFFVSFYLQNCFFMQNAE